MSNGQLTTGSVLPIPQLASFQPSIPRYRYHRTSSSCPASRTRHTKPVTTLHPVFLPHTPIIPSQASSTQRRKRMKLGRVSCLLLPSRAPPQTRHNRDRDRLYQRARRQTAAAPVMTNPPRTLDGPIGHVICLHVHRLEYPDDRSRSGRVCRSHSFRPCLCLRLRRHRTKGRHTAGDLGSNAVLTVYLTYLDTYQASVRLLLLLFWPSVRWSWWRDDDVREARFSVPSRRLAGLNVG